MNTVAVSTGDRGYRLPAVLLLLTMVVPALAASWGFDDGRLAFVRYREPKLIALAILGWILVSTFLWSFWRRLSFSEVRRVLRRPPMLLLAVFLGYLMTTGLWVRVPQNYCYELNQYLLLFVLLVVLLMWSERQPAVAGMVRGGLVAGLALVTVVGLFQWVVPIPFLSPINPEIGAPHPSFMGYKNPAALALLGQIFLLAQFVFTTTRRPWRLLLGALLAVELVYLISLGSRTSYMALGVAILYLLGLWWAHVPTLRRALRGVLVGAAALLLLGAALAIHPPSRQRAASMAAYLAHPSSYLDSDRGTYLLNTLNMVRHRPLGVGLGDWQTHYPVFRLHDPARSFSAGYQVRRAHSDHVQLLGEAGWPGLALWIAFLAILVWTTAREHLNTGRWAPFFVSGQLVAFIAAMATDYVIELPYHKAQFFFVVFLAVATQRSGPPARFPDRSRVFLGAALVVSCMAFGQIVLHVELARKLHLAARLEQSYTEVLQAPTGPNGERNPRLFARPYLLGTRFASLFGHTKTFHKDWLILAHSAERFGRREVALAATRKTLALHPYYSPAYLLMSRLEDEPEAAQRWRRAHEHLMQGPAHGFAGPPPLDLRGPVP
ncbi:MAG: O-antigen ligase family protein [Thermoanaerobaculales bacterium]|nr:O-antigen ligase family protein [Thermoanaerobaculales bacterium]